MNKDQVVAIEYQEDAVTLRLADGRIIGNPLVWHAWLAEATDSQRAHVEMYESSVYFPDLDEGLDIEEMLKGEPPHAKKRPAAVS